MMFYEMRGKALMFNGRFRNEGKERNEPLNSLNVIFIFLNRPRDVPPRQVNAKFEATKLHKTG